MGVVFLLTPFIPALNREWHSETLIGLAGQGRAAGRRGGVRDRLDAVHEHHARRDPHAGRGLQLGGARRAAARLLLAGLAIPFLLIALAFERMAIGLNVVKRHFPVVIGVGGAVMIALGLLILTGEFTVLNT